MLLTQGAVPKALRGRRIFSLDLLNLSAGTSMRGEFEKRMKEIITYLQRNKKEVILFVDEIHALVGAGKAAGASDATQMLKVPLARGDIVCVNAESLEAFESLSEHNTHTSVRQLASYCVHAHACMSTNHTCVHTHWAWQLVMVLGLPAASLARRRWRSTSCTSRRTLRSAADSNTLWSRRPIKKEPSVSPPLLLQSSAFPSAS